MSEKLSKEERAHRLAQALRENLKKRKQQQRDRDVKPESDSDTLTESAT